jgi:rubrerythrin
MKLWAPRKNNQNINKENQMAVFKCEKCGATKEGRCKPKKCPACTEAGTMQKQEENKSSGCGCACSAKK